MRITIEGRGDPEVGIEAEHIEIEWSGLEDNCEWDARSQLKAKLLDFFGAYLDGTPRVYFEDECGQCGRIMADLTHCGACDAEGQS